jgi:hypothetical protein
VADDTSGTFDHIADVLMRLSDESLGGRRAVAAVIAMTLDAIAERFIGHRMGRSTVADAHQVGISFGTFAAATIAARAWRTWHTLLPGN